MLSSGWKDDKRLVFDHGCTKKKKKKKKSLVSGSKRLHYILSLILYVLWARGVFAPVIVL